MRALLNFFFSPSKCQELQLAISAHQELRCVDVHCVREFFSSTHVALTGCCYRVHCKSFIPHNSST